MSTAQCKHLIEQRGRQRATLEDFLRQVPGARTVEPDGPGPWFIAGYHGACSACGFDIEPGDEIRADGQGGWECRECDR